MTTEIQHSNRSPGRRRRTAAVLAIGLAMAAIVRAGPAMAASPPLPVRFYSQLDPAWGTLLVGYHEDVRMRSMGSLLTCIAMVASYYGLLPWYLVPGTPPDGAPSPDYIHAWLQDTNGYLPTPPKTVVIDYTLGFAFQDVAGYPISLDFKPFDGPDRETINRYLLAGREPTILYMQRAPNRYHPVVVVGWDESTGSYLVLDPARPRWYDSPVPLASLYGSGWANMVAGGLVPILPWSTVPEYDVELYPLLSVTTKSPVEISGVDPNGRRVGWDAATGSVVADVPGASYLPQPVWADPTGLLQDRAPGRVLTIPSVREGRYRFEMIATGDGPFTLNARAYGADRARIVADGVTGTVATGDVLKFQIEYSESGPSGFTVGDNFEPEAKAGGAQAVIVGGAVAFDAGASFDIDGTIASYAWDFGDGATASGATAAHPYGATGTYTASLTVTDDKGATGTDVAVISVYPDQLLEGTTERVSLTPWNTEPFGNFGSFLPSLSADGRFVAFMSGADNFGPAHHGTYVRDRQVGTTEWVSTPQCNSTAFPVLSADGRWVVYQCSSDDPAWHASIVVSDRETGAHERIDVSPAGEPGTCEDTFECRSSAATISADGRFVAFLSKYDNLVPGDTNGYTDVFVHDRETGTTERVSVSDAGAQSETGAAARADHDQPAISADGRFVAFASGSTDLVPGTLGFDDRVYVRDRLLQRTELVSVRSDGTFGNYTGGFNPSISADGRLVAFESGSTDLVPGDTNGVNDIFIHDRDTGSTERVSITGAGAQATCPPLEADGCNRDPIISRDGRIVAFRSRATNLVLGDTNNADDVFVRDLEAGTTELVSRSTEGELGNGASGEGLFINDLTVIALSDDGRFVAFCSDATNLIPTDGNGIEDLYVRDRQAAGLVADPSGPYLGWAGSLASPAAVAFDASGSLHPMGEALTAHWDFGDGSPIVEASAAVPASHSYSAPGTFTVTLVVTDGEHSSPAVSTAAHILPTRSHSLTLARACGEAGDHITVSVAGHALVSPAEGWDLGKGTLPAVRTAHPGGDVLVRVDGPEGEVAEDVVPIAAFSASSALEFSTLFGWTIGAAEPGTYTLSLPGETGVAGISGTFVVPCPPLANEPPHAAVGGPYGGTVGVPVSFDGSGSSDPEGAPLTYEWGFEDGTTATGPLPGHTFTAPGTYWVLLVVNDGELDSPTSVGTNSYTTVTIADSEPSGPCDAVPTGATYRSLDCRLTAAREATLAGVAAGRMRKRLVTALDRARQRLDQSQALCADDKATRSKGNLRRMRTWVSSYQRRLRSAQAGDLVSEAIRAQLLSAALAVRADGDTLRRALVCPAEADPDLTGSE
jgi:PKD repeat protein